MARPEMSDYGLDWWVKWAATILALVHVYVVSHDIQSWYKFTGFTCAFLWTWLGYLWRQSSIVLLNAIMMAIYLKGILGL